MQLVPYVLQPPLPVLSLWEATGTSDTLAAAGGRKVVALWPQRLALRAVAIVLLACLP